MQPSSSPYLTSSSSVTIEISCELGTTINWAAVDNSDDSAAGSGSGACNESTLTYSFDYSAAATLATEQYTITMNTSDEAGNTSTNLSFVYAYDNTVPTTPVIDASIARPFYTNTGSFTIAGTSGSDCTDGYTLTLGGDIEAAEVTSPSGSLTFTCGSTTSGMYSFTGDKSLGTGDTEGTFDITLKQINATTFTESASTQLRVIYDKTAPDAPNVTSTPLTITAPSPLSIAGDCEPGADVAMTGSDTQSMTCTSGGSFSFSVTETVDATLNTYSITQTDLATNVSAATTVSWTLDLGAVAMPVITAPAADILTNTDVVNLQVSCIDGYTVTLGGTIIATDVTDPLETLSQVCSGSQVSYTIQKTSDGDHTMSVYQTDLGGGDSATTSRVWTRETVPPDVINFVPPSNPNYQLSAIVSFESSDTAATFQCRLDTSSTQGSYTGCSSPVEYTDLSGGETYTVYVRAIDAAGNITATPASSSWYHEGRLTLALFHMDTAGPTDDDSGYSGSLTDSGTAEDTSGKFSQARAFVKAESDSMSASDSLPLSAMTRSATFEMWIKPTTFSNNERRGLLSQMGASDNSFEITMYKQGGSSNIRLEFSATEDGTNMTALSGSSVAIGTGIILGDWNHIAVTYSLGNITFFVNGNVAGTKTFGTVGTSALFDSSSDIVIGNNSAGEYFDGSIDEVRISQSVRYVGTFTPDASSFTAD